MNVEELIVDELRRDAAAAPSGAAVRTAVREAVANLPTPQAHPARRWAVPLLAAAAVVALAVIATLLVPRAFERHSAPARPAPSLPLPPAPKPVGLSCPAGQQIADGPGARFTGYGGAVRYVYDYFCASPDGDRGVSQPELFDAALHYQGPLRTHPGGDFGYLMSLAPSADGLTVQYYVIAHGGPGTSLVYEFRIAFGRQGSQERTALLAKGCQAVDLTVKTSSADEPTPHEVLRLTNRGAAACAVWGNPHYSWQDRAMAGAESAVVRGPAGGLPVGQLAAPPLLLQPGDTASAAIGVDWSQESVCSVSQLNVTLPDGVNLGPVGYNVCNLVTYPLVLAGNGSVDHPESEAPKPATGSCGVADRDIVFGLGLTKHLAGGRIGRVLTLTANSAASCTIEGFPNFRMLDAGGDLIVIADQRPLAGASTGPVTVSPDHPASALIDWTPGECYPAGQFAHTFGAEMTVYGQSTGPVCDLAVHQFVAGSTGTG